MIPVRSEITKIRVTFVYDVTVMFPCLPGILNCYITAAEITCTGRWALLGLLRCHRDVEINSSRWRARFALCRGLIATDHYLSLLIDDRRGEIENIIDIN